MRIKKSNLILNLILPILTILGIFLIWFFASIIVNEEIILPTPIDTIKELFRLFGEKVFWVGIGGTLIRSFVAFTSSFIIASGLALLTKYSKVGKSIIAIIVSIIRALPTIAVILLLLLWTNSKVASIIVTMIVILPTIYNSQLQGLNVIDPEILEMFKVYGVSKKVQFKKYILPQVTPPMIETIGSGLSLNIKLIVASEVIASVGRSIGQLMNESKVYFETAQLFALVLIIIVIAVIIEFLSHVIAGKFRRKYGNKKSN